MNPKKSCERRAYFFVTDDRRVILKQKDLLGLYDLTAEEISEILSLGLRYKASLRKNEKNFSDLRGKTITTLFYENSTRTRSSFELAGKYLGANVVNIVASSSSVQKGETLVDTGETLDMLKNDFIAIRHPMAGAPKLLAQNVAAHVLNAGDGMNEHPTQALLDMLTMLETFKTIAGLKVAILGDIRHSRVAKSNLYGLKKLGAEVTMYAPKTLIPTGIEEFGAGVCASREEAVAGADVIMGLRIQLERQKGGLFPSLGEYAKYYGADEALLAHAKKEVLILHPGPVNRGVELSSTLIDGEHSRIQEQVLSGVAVHMACLKLLSEGK